MLLFLTSNKVNSDTFIKNCVKEYLNLCCSGNEDFCIVREDYKKPYISPPLAEFSLSHSGDYTIVAVSHKEVGVDIQKHNACDSNTIAKRFFPLQEQELDKTGFFDLWAAKEAYAKCNDINLIKSLKTFIKDKKITLLNLIDNYSVAISSKDKDILIIIK